MEVSKDCIVGITYVLRDGSGDEIERCEEDEPFYFLHGHGNLISGLEEALDGLAEGDAFDEKFEPEEAYGEYNPKLVQRVSRAQFPEDIDLKPGTPIQLVSEGSEEGSVFFVDEVDDDEVVLDGNRPLAGKALHFKGVVVEVREATDEELAHGHAHTGAHHH
ncbi:MAG: FKBP-type peptidyl-prolyl cis-trans isomerase [Persicimonas sp.]